MKKIIDYLKEKTNINEKDIEKAKEVTRKKTSEFLENAQDKIEKNYDIINDKTENFINNYNKSKEPTSKENWYKRAAQSCEDVTDSILREDSGTSTKITKAVAGKLGAAGTSVGIFSIASLLGTASTGTAIGSLSGAAFTSASLAWLGGSVIMGSIIIGVASIAGGIGVLVGAGWVYKNYLYGEKRQKSTLELKEQNIIDVCLSLATAFQQKAKAGEHIDPLVAKALYADALQPLSEDLLSYKTKTESWPFLAQKRFKDATEKLVEITKSLKKYSEKNPNVSIGIVSAVILELLSNNLQTFSVNESMVLDALRRSNNQLTGATNKELSDYIKSLEPEQLSGLQNNIKGIYHELRFINEENNDNDEYIAEIFEATNHAGADVKIINTITGEIKEVQLKATDYLSYIKRHNERYEDIEVFATSEVASESSDITSTDILNRELNEDVKKVVDNLDDYADTEIISSMTIAAMITLAKNSRLLLRGDNISVKEKEEVIKNGTIAAGAAGLVSLLIG